MNAHSPVRRLATSRAIARTEESSHGLVIVQVARNAHVGVAISVLAVLIAPDLERSIR
jgi:hypothetical protein